jgi:hypothetical protein
MNARAVIEQMVQRYGAFESYSDSGQVTFTHPNVVTKTLFSTHYSAPSLFRFDFQVPHPHPPSSHVVTQHAVGFDGTKAYAIRKRFKGRVETESHESTGLAIAGAAGISCGAALTIGRLLFTDTGAVPLPRKLLSEHGTSSFEESRMHIRINELIEDEFFTATLRDQAA